MRARFIVIFVVILDTTLADRAASCTTPNREKATCVPISACEVIIDALKTRHSSAILFAQQSQCGYNLEPLVCCGSTGYPNTPETKNKVTTKPEAEDLILSNFNTKALPDRTVCGVQEERYRLIGGEVTYIGEFPWMAALEYKWKTTGENAGIRCGGSLINNRYVMTAAHCIVNENFQLMKVWLGDWRISTDPDCEKSVANVECAEKVKKINVKEAIFYPFHWSGSNDIGLLRLEHDIKYTYYIRPICLPPSNMPIPEVGTKFTVAGWGANKNGTLSDFKLKMEIPLLSNSNCKNKYEVEVNQNRLCAGGEKGKDSCRGDLGGPLMGIYEDNVNDLTQWYQEGVVSHNGCSDHPTVFTRVRTYISWIKDVIKVD